MYSHNMVGTNNVEKAKELIGFSADVELEDGIRRTAEWIAANEPNLPRLAPIFCN